MNFTLGRNVADDRVVRWHVADLRDRPARRCQAARDGTRGPHQGCRRGRRRCVRIARPAAGVHVFRSRLAFRRTQMVHQQRSQCHWHRLSAPRPAARGGAGATARTVSPLYRQPRHRLSGRRQSGRRGGQTGRRRGAADGDLEAGHGGDATARRLAPGHDAADSGIERDDRHHRHARDGDREIIRPTSSSCCSRC